jgi:hypothetical protein
VPEAVDELEKISLELYKDGCSVVALKDGQVVGLSFNNIQHSVAPNETSFFENVMNKHCKTEVAKEYLNLMIKV